MLDFPFTCADIKHGIRKLKNGKKEGPDLILNEFIKTGTTTLTLTLVKLFNRILQSGKFPKLWNHSLISSIYKSGDPNDCNNYRGISVTSCLGKLFTSLLQKRLGDFLESRNLISHNQGGFRGGYRTTDHIYILKTLINKYLNKHKQKMYVCFVDFKKAFDSVDRRALLTKLLRKGIDGKFFEIIKDMYSNTMYSCKFNNSYSEPFLANTGVKQGDSLSPTLFNVFVDDIDSCFIDNSNTDPVTLGQYKLNHLLYADDLALISESPTGLQHCLNSLDNYCRVWGLNINTKKTKIMIFSKNQRIHTANQDFDFSIGLNKLEVVKEYKYLGLIFTSNGKLNLASENLAQKARKAYFGLRSKIPFSDNLSVQNWIKLFDSVITPVITYGSEIWITDFKVNLNNIDLLPFEKVQNMIMKNILGVHGKTSNLALHAELGLYPLCFKVFKLMFKFYSRMLQLEQTTDNVYNLLRSAFAEDKLLHDQGTPCWIKSVHQLKNLFNLQSLDIPYSEFIDKMNNYYVNKIVSQISTIRNTESGKLRFFSKIYTNFELQKYLTFSIDKNLRLLLSKLRLSAHSLAIETGRYNRPLIPAYERYCKFCVNEVENEKHFLLDCSLYNTIREKHTSLFQNHLITDEHLSKILNPTTLQETKNICLYLRESFSKRDIELKNI